LASSAATRPATATSRLLLLRHRAERERRQRDECGHGDDGKSKSCHHKLLWLDAGVLFAS
jgi:hypothetical protein